jgi:hypothetical protein
MSSNWPRKAEIIRLKDGRDLSYTVFGVKSPEPGKTIIYFHGFMSSRLEASVLHDKAIEIGVRIIAADRPGYGESTHDPNRTPDSSVKDIEQLLEALLPPDEKVVFYGVSGKERNHLFKPTSGGGIFSLSFLTAQAYFICVLTECLTTYFQFFPNRRISLRISMCCYTSASS